MSYSLPFSSPLVITAIQHSYVIIVNSRTQIHVPYSEPGDVIESTTPAVADYSDDYCGTISIDTFLLIVTSAADCGGTVCARTGAIMPVL